jgi:hypothetical protein
MPSQVLKYRDFTGGMVPDIFPHKQLPNQCTMMYNYRNWKSACSKVGGQEEQIPNMPLVKPNLLDFWRQQFSQDNSYFMTAKGGKVFKTDPTGISGDITGNGGEYVNVITGAPLGDDTIWLSTQLYGGLTWLCNNGEITPQYVTSNGQISPAGLLQDIPGWIWNSTTDNNPYVARTCAVMRSFDNQLWAANITNKRQDGTLEFLPNVILYSDKSTNPANTKGGYVPDTWQPSSGTTTLASNWAGFVSLDTSDPIVDMVPLRDNLFVFTQNACYIVSKLQFAQAGLSPQRFSEVRGLLSNDCAVTFDGQLLLVTQDDIILTTGSSLDFPSLANQRIKDEFFNQYLTRNINWQQNVFARYNRFYNEVWIFFPSQNSVDGSCDMALIWDVESRGWSLVDVPSLYSAVYAPTIGNGTTTGIRNWSGLNYAYNRLHFCDGDNLLVQDVGYKRAYGATESYQTIYEKVFDMEQEGGEPTNIKGIEGIYPFIRGNVDVTVQLKFSNIPFSNGVDWTTPDYAGLFTTSEDYKIDPLRGGRYLAMRLITDDTESHDITSFDFAADVKGRRG